MVTGSRLFLALSEQHLGGVLRSSQFHGVLALLGAVTLSWGREMLKERHGSQKYSGGNKTSLGEKRF